MWGCDSALGDDALKQRSGGNVLYLDISRREGQQKLITTVYRAQKGDLSHIEPWMTMCRAVHMAQRILISS